MSRGVHRGVYSALVDDLDFQGLAPRSKHVFLTLRISKEAGPACIFVFYPEITVRQTGYTLRQIEAALVELQSPPNHASPWILREGPVLWLRNALRHDPTMKLGNENHRKAVERWVNGLPRVKLVLKFCDYYQIRKPFDSLPDPIGVPFTSEDRRPSTEDRIPKTEDPLPKTEDPLPNTEGAGHPNGHAHAPGPVVLSDGDRKFLDSLPDPYRVQWLGAPEWWISLGDGYPGVNVQREASKYMAYHDSLEPGQKHKNVRMGFRRWVAKAARWLEQDAMRKAVRR